MLTFVRLMVMKSGHESAKGVPGGIGKTTIVVAPMVDHHFTSSLYPGYTIFSGKHLNARRHERKIKIAEIRETLDKPDTSYPCREKDTIRFVKQFGDVHIHVIAIVSEAKKLMYLKTVMALPTPKRMEKDENKK